MFTRCRASFIEKISASFMGMTPFGIINRHKHMKQKIMIGVLVALLAQGCIVKSLQPFFNQRDLEFHEEIISTWVDQDGHSWKIDRIKEQPHAYQMQWLEGDKPKGSFLVHLFRLEGQLYVDFFPLSADSDSGNGQIIFDLHLMPTHSIARVDEISATALRLKWLNEEWMASLFRQNRIKISHEEIMDENPKDENDKMYILTASTDELQRFLIKYGDEDRAFDNGNTVFLTLKNTAN